MIALLALAAFVFGQGAVSLGLGATCRAAACTSASDPGCCCCAEEHPGTDTDADALGSPCPERPANPICPDGCIWCVAKASSPLPVGPSEAISCECLGRLGPDALPRLPAPFCAELTPPPRA